MAGIGTVSAHARSVDVRAAALVEAIVEQGDPVQIVNYETRAPMYIRWFDGSTPGIPPVDAHGALPPGLHQASWGEFLTRFGSGSDRRVALAAELGAGLAYLNRVGIDDVAIGGSFVTTKVEPGDVDLIYLPTAGSVRRLGSPSGAVAPTQRLWGFDDLQALSPAFVEMLGTSREGRHVGLVRLATADAAARPTGA
ncbi:MAG: hypothetical protein JWO69_1209 [Thermoleophilia bacterium]|jgi:hypothetical protein|nr:hypothetical protein [Thermoleophilia bacterium]